LCDINYHAVSEIFVLRFKVFSEISFTLGGYIIIMGSALLDEKELDKEWLELILEARNLGIPFDEIMDFLKQSS
jgi:hypothetical protein